METTTSPLIEKTIIRVSFNNNRHKYSLYTPREDNNGWRSVAYRNEVFLKQFEPHFYRGTQRKWLKGESRYKTPFYFLEGSFVDSPNLEEFDYAGELHFDPDKDKNFLWVLPRGNKIVISSELDSSLPEDYLVHCAIASYKPIYFVYCPLVN